MITTKLFLLHAFASIARASVDLRKTTHFRVWAPNAKWVSVHSIGDRWPATNLTKNSAALGLEAENWEADVAGVKPGDCYVFRIDGHLERIDPRAQDINRDGSCSIVSSPYSWKTDRIVVPLSRAVLYEVHIGTFTKEGTFEAAIERLDHLMDLGVTMIELMPVEYSGDLFGYTPKAPYAVSPWYGGSLGLKRFVDAAAQRGIAVAIDIVWNHAASDSFLHRYDGPDDIYFGKGIHGQAMWGLRPDFEREGSLQYIFDNFAMWMEEFHIGGFRWDSSLCTYQEGANCGTASIAGFKLMQRVNDLVHSGTFVGTLTFAEDFQQWLAITQPVDDGVSWFQGTSGGTGFDGQWQDVTAIRTYLSRPEAETVDIAAVAYDCAAGNVPERLIYVETHDQVGWPCCGRIPTFVSNNLGYPTVDPRRYLVHKKSMLINSMALLCTGTPLLFMGQEFMSSQPFISGQTGPLDWTVAEENAAIVREVGDVIKLRTKILDFDPEGGGRLLAHRVDIGIAVIQRCSASRGVVLIVNAMDLHHDALDVFNMPYDGVWHALFDGDSSAYSPYFSDHCADQKTVSSQGGHVRVCVPPLGVVVLATDVIVPGACLEMPVRNRMKAPLTAAPIPRPQHWNFMSPSVVLIIVLSVLAVILAAMCLHERRKWNQIRQT
eukprot:TRINITY_DN15888_c1_g1_i1.p1 TRINITY_DN15888_c1_g1~~TRINITY_DN15888_c1_g1_i1.p1  ORF type:complete len:660 (+),score=72.80 TRINITY_DN15888_c1_g1_i1:55-2034(+)